MRLTAILRIVLLVVAAAMIVGAAVLAWLGSSFLFAFVFTNGLLVLVYIGVAMACSIVRDRGIQPWRMLSGVAAALFVAACSIGIVVAIRWIPLPSELALVLWAAGLWAVLMAVTGLLALPAPRAGWWLVLRRATVICLYVVAAAIVLGLSFHPGVSPMWTLLGITDEYWAGELLERLGFALVLLAGAMVAVTFLTMWMTPPLVKGGATLPLWLRCPRCGTEHNRRTGDDRCERCGLRITVLVQ